MSFNINYKYFTQEQLTRYKNKIPFEKSLEIETNIIGYRNQGESIIVFVKADNEIYFSGVVDSYKTSKTDKIKEILESNKIKCLDFICWSHPDLDHSKGIEDIIRNYSSKKTNIWIPEGLDKSDNYYCKRAIKILDQIKKDFIKKHLNIISVSDNKNLINKYCYCFFKDTEAYPLEIESYTPSSRILRKEDYLDSLINNDQSIFFEIALGKARIWLTSDVLNSTLIAIEDNFIKENIHILKIPHHCSTTSNKIMNLYNYCDVACSTVYKVGNNNLPNKDMMKLYRQKSRNLYCTKNIDIDANKYNYGIIKIITNIVDRNYKIELIGNTVECFPVSK